MNEEKIAFPRPEEQSDANYKAAKRIFELNALARAWDIEIVPAQNALMIISELIEQAHDEDSDEDAARYALLAVRLIKDYNLVLSAQERVAHESR